MTDKEKRREELLKYFIDYKNNLNIIKQKGKNLDLELEVKFGTRGIKPISKIDYENVVKKLINNGFNIQVKDLSLLRISSEYIDTKTGQSKISNLRVELNGTNNVQKYCLSNDIKQLLDNKENVNFVIKKPYNDDNKIYKPINFDEWNFRVSLSEERKLGEGSPIVKTTIRDWNDTKKVFRLINRTKLVKKINGFEIFTIDLSIVRENHKRGKFSIPEYSFEASDVINSSPKYEIEIEFNNNEINNFLYNFQGEYDNFHNIIDKELKSIILLILSGLQETNYPVSYDEQKSILKDYMNLVNGSEYDENTRIQPKHFIGPSSYTLSIKNIVPLQNENETTIPNIRNNYTVTDKADGERKMLYISNDGKIYLIDMNMRVQFTGCIEERKEFYNTLIDGEHILHDKNGNFINLYASFDIYFIKGTDVRSYKFVPFETSKSTEAEIEMNKKNHRLPLLINLIKGLKLQNINKNSTKIPLRVSYKSFYIQSETKNIFNNCSLILRNVKEGMYEYETDGLIFTPMNLGVGLSNNNDKPKNTKITWEYSFKWKPVEFNTIDFLVTTKKNENGREIIGNLFQEGNNNNDVNKIVQYKDIILRVGFDEKLHGYINPCQDILDDKYSEEENKDDDKGYRPMQFFPTSPYDPQAGICKIILKGTVNDKVMYTEDGDIFGDNTIVEFRYDMDRENGWRWVPLRVRYDKTADYLAGNRNYGNAYHVANSNWQSIHNPITEKMITTGTEIPEELGDDDVYYNRVTTDSSTRGLRDFHNLFVKKLLITKMLKRGGTIIDMAVGKGGDIPKWISAKSSFVFGLDVAKDNIENRLDGVCARYLNYKRKYNYMPDGLFVHGDSTLNIRNGNAFYNDKTKQIVRAIFGMGAKEVKTLGKLVYKQYGKAQKGFDLSTLQFSIHYMFKDQQTVHNIMRNICEVTKVGGYFISTQYDGQTVFNKLKNLEQNEMLTIMEEGKKLWEITKRYDHDEFLDDGTSIGYAIDVYQESINKVFREYLVNYNYVVRLMENYGFVPLTNEEAKRIGFNSSSGLFSELYGMMQNEVRRDPTLKTMYGKSLDMTQSEKSISFLNRWMIFKKVRDVNAEIVYKNMLEMSMYEENIIQKITDKANIAQEQELKSLKPLIPPRKLKKRVKLVLLEE